MAGDGEIGLKMEEKEPSSNGAVQTSLSINLEVSGLKEMAETAGHISEAAIDSATQTLRTIFGPAASESGYLLRDIVAGWRERNFIRSMSKTQKLLDAHPLTKRLRAHPRLVHLAVNESSMTDDDTLQDLWAQLLVKSGSESAPDEENLIYMNILKELTGAEARLMLLAKDNTILMGFSKKFPAPLGRIFEADAIKNTCGFKNDRHLQAALSHMVRLDLLNIGTELTSGKLKLVASSEGLQFCYVLGCLDVFGYYFEESERYKEGGWVAGSSFITNNGAHKNDW